MLSNNELRSQIIAGLTIIVVGLLTIPMLDGDATFALFLAICGIGLIVDSYRELSRRAERRARRQQKRRAR